ncbi:hypothetical protein ARMGADRAFT_1006414 [Armillaria gallica]|uniref:Uncharacterized protein n=1 Tax=Armillaria gallica TaxID=47427 RepID=A0A2H3EAH5_ARMGA|nr:hypothetical protein ARMGADRAFT_1006414 [Armillaria gallica]
MNLTVSDLSTCLLSRRRFPPYRPAGTALGDVPPSQLQENLNSCQTNLRTPVPDPSLLPRTYILPWMPSRPHLLPPSRYKHKSTQLKTYETSARHPREPAKIVPRRDP